MIDPRVRLNTTVSDSSDVDLAGATLHQISVLQTEDGRLVTFVTPSISHLALDAAVRSACTANECRATLMTSQPSRTVFAKPVTHIEDGERQGALYDTFLHAMSAAIFSYLSVESFANEVIGRHPDALVSTIERPRRVHRGGKSDRRWTKRVTASARDAEKKSLSLKLSQVLPQVTGIGIDKGKDPFQAFQRLERLRNSVTHMKSSTSVTRPKDLDKVSKQPLWEDFVDKDSLWMPRTALQIIEHFWIDTLPLDWLPDIEARMNNCHSSDTA